MSNCAIVGINWGDEGKGRMVDYFAGQFDVCLLYTSGRRGDPSRATLSEQGLLNALRQDESGIFVHILEKLAGDSANICEDLTQIRLKSVR